MKLEGAVGESTFGRERLLNQRFYTSMEWRRIKSIVIDRDRGCDLGIPGREIHSGLLVHHMNPITPQDLIHGNEDVLDPEFLITTTHQTHNAIHYGSEALLPKPYTPRRPGDTRLW